MIPTEIMHSLKVINKIKETQDASTLELEVPADKKELFNYKPGQFITFFMDINGEQVNRSYSFSSSPLADKNLKVTVKRVPGGLGSNHLINDIQVGDTLKSSPPAGSFFSMQQTIEEELEYYLFAAGSGVTPMMSLIKWSLPNLGKHKINLIYSNKNPNSTLFLNELEALEKQYENLKVTYFFSQHEEKNERLGEIELATILSKAFESKTQKSFYLCGPNGYMEMIERQLLKRDVASEWIHKESFFLPEAKPSSSKSGASHDIFIGSIPSTFTKEDCQSISADIDGEMITVEGNSDESLLEVLLEQGHTPPFSCMSGSCQACMCHLVEGKVFQESMGILTDDDLNNGNFLSCQAKAVSKNVNIKFIG